MIAMEAPSDRIGSSNANPPEDGSSVAGASEISISSPHDLHSDEPPAASTDRAPTNPATATATATATESTCMTPAMAADSARSSTNDNSDERRRLTEDEKKQNHVASENKRREAIREGFDRLADIVPGLQGRGRSEALVLERTLEFLREQLQRRKDLIERIEERGGTVDPKFRVPDLPPDFFDEGGLDMPDLDDD